MPGLIEITSASMHKYQDLEISCVSVTEIRLLARTHSLASALVCIFGDNHSERRRSFKRPVNISVDAHDNHVQFVYW